VAYLQSARRLAQGARPVVEGEISSHPTESSQCAYSMVELENWAGRSLL
jgi:hypothetical protein